MSAVRMDGKALAQEIREAVGERASALSRAHGRPPCLAVVLVGDDPASHVYVRNKHRACAEAGIVTRDERLDASTPAEDVRATVEALNADPAVDGLLVQLPLPGHLSADEVRDWIAPEKDVDGLHAENIGRLAAGTPRFVPCTPAGCLEMLRHQDIPTAGREAVVVGRSLIVGRPMAALLSMKGVDATVTLCHSRSRDLAGICARADILIAAAGQPGLVTPGFVKPGAAVVDVGIHRVEDASRRSGYRLVGDVVPAVAEVAGHLSPVPGGVGPMTIALLLRNTVDAMARRLDG